jgi:hypothetical protein
MVQLYHSIAEDADSRTRSYVISQLLVHLRAFSDTELDLYFAELKLETGKLALVAKYRLLTLSICGELIKASIDHHDNSSFHLFGSFMDRFIKDEHSDVRATEIERLQYGIEDSHLQNEVKDEAQSRLDRLQLIRDTDLKIEAEAKLVWFGISAWLLRQIRNGRLSQNDWSTEFQYSRNPFSELGELSSLFLQIYAEGERTMGWDNWVLNELPVGKVHWVDTRSWTLAFYCVQALHLLPDEIPDDYSPIQPSKQLESLINDIKKSCIALRDEAETLGMVLPQSDIDRVDDLIELHRRALQVANQQHLEWLRDTPLDKELVEDLRKKMAEKLSQQLVIRSAIKATGTIALTPGFPESGFLCQYARWLPKEALVREKYSSYVSMDSDLAREFARAEDVCLIDALPIAHQHIWCFFCRARHPDR